VCLQGGTSYVCALCETKIKVLYHECPCMHLHLRPGVRSARA